MRCLSKKILCYIICGLLTFSVTSTVYYKSVHAMEWVGGALAFEEALKWLLAAIGITATAGMTDAYWEEYGDEFTDYAIENGATQTEVAEWQLKACQGIIDKGSVVWSKFKSWASELVNGGGASLDNYFTSGENASSVVSKLNNLYNTNFGIDSNLGSKPIYAIYVKHRVDIDKYEIILTYSNGPVSVSGSSGSFTINSGSHLSKGLFADVFSDSGSGSISWGDISDTVFSDNYTNNTNTTINYGFYFDSSGGVADDNFEAANTNVDDLDVISSDGVDENEDEVTTTMPGVSDSDNEASKDAYQDIIDKINDGTITQEKGLEQIQELLKVIAYDTVTDEVVPPQKNDDGTNKTKDDALKENKENMGFTLGGLEAVFPFCIPFDIYAFMTLLVAEPECPEFDFPIKSVNGQVEEIHVDLEPFEPVAVVVRYVFDFLFIIGLAMLTRSLIGGGSSD